ncbi:hypothetical protein H5410_014106 [Solanum commersonii]|uniref:Uncharacterized protein n=1 Tax=Solanum commersonii TaxID=4109 RepID=A0A9J5ZQE0_SOLCO|nr:hypothetical protein H5410_014106 [Solanum commersonii]
MTLSLHVDANFLTRASITAKGNLHYVVAAIICIQVVLTVNKFGASYYNLYKLLTTIGANLSWGIIDAAKGKTPTAQIFKLVYVYAIWIERNHRIFDKDSKTWESLAREIAYICCVRASQKTMQAIHQFAF